ncbi:MAG: hypothetical protein IT160_10745 [Bryobacterales bacterium]|nr:hypothetical protein [Bryobacterales bacterium]
MPDSAELLKPEKNQTVRIEQAEIVFGVLSFNNAGSIGSVLAAVRDTLNGRFAGVPSAILHADSGSSDGTVEIVRESSGDGPPLLVVHEFLRHADRVAVPYHGLPGMSSAVRTILETARTAGAHACAVVDGGRTTVTPDGIEWLVRPVIEQGIDFVAPYYQRHKYDGALTRGIVYPLLRCLYGRRIRQPIGADFGFSRTMMDGLLAQKGWDQDQERFATDVWMTTVAASGNYRIAEAVLGAHIRDSHEAAPELSTALSQITGSVFSEMDARVQVWQRMRTSERVPLLGSYKGDSTQPVNVNVRRMTESFRLGYQDLRDLWSKVLPPASIIHLKRMAAQTDQTFHFDDDLWARILFDFAVAYRLRVIAREHLLGSLTPLYLGWVASYVRDVELATAAEAERRMEHLCGTFESLKPYLISRWRWPERAGQ